MLLISYAYYYLYYEKSPNYKPKGAQHTPGRGVVGTLRLVDSLKPYAPEFLMMMFEADILYKKSEAAKFGMPKVLKRNNGNNKIQRKTNTNTHFTF